MQITPGKAKLYLDSRHFKLTVTPFTAFLYYQHVFWLGIFKESLEKNCCWPSLGCKPFMNYEITLRIFIYVGDNQKQIIIIGPLELKVLKFRAKCGEKKNCI